MASVRFGVSPVKVLGIERRWLWLIAIVLLAWSGVHAVRALRYEFMPRNFGVVEPGRVYRSGQLSERMLRKVIEEHGIRTIVALNERDAESAMERAVADDLGVQRYAYDLRGDGTGDPADFGEALYRIQQPDNHPVLVHCTAGAQRTTTLIILYEHLVRGASIEDAYPRSFDFKHKPDEWELLAYLAEHKAEIIDHYDRWVKTGQVPAVP